MSWVGPVEIAVLLGGVLVVVGVAYFSMALAMVLLILAGLTLLALGLRVATLRRRR